MKKLISMTLAATLLLSTAVYASDSFAATQKGVDVVAAASTTAPTTPAPAPAPAPKPATKPAAPKPAAKPAAPKTTTTKPTTADTVKITRILKVGTKGNDVKLLQTLLIKKGYALKADGDFGNATANAVKDFQGKNSLQANGIVGPETVAALYAVAKPAVPATPATPATTGKPAVPATPATPAAPAKPDVIASASVVSDNAAFEAAIGPNGKWIIATLKDLTFDKPLVLTGNFKNGKKDAATGLAAIQRKIALYTQDEKRNVTARFTLTAPKLTILSPNASIQHGTFVGDLYVGVPNFKLVDTIVKGNVYFTNKDAMDTFSMDDKSSITGKKESVAVDAVTTASIVNDNAGFEKAIAKDGKWIIASLKNLVFDKELVLTGNFKNGKKDAKTGLDAIQRKIALYTQDDKHVTTGRFMLTAPKLTILSPNSSIQKGIFKGDVYVGVPNFKLVDAVVDGNIYFSNKDAADTFSADATSIVTGSKVYTAVDAVTSASLVKDNANFEKATAKDGNWIIALLKNLVFDKEIALAGDFHDKNDTTKALKHKLALYTQDDKHVTTGRFMLTAPKLTITSPNATIQKGFFKGDVYVSADGFNLVDAVIDGNIYFTTQTAKDTFTMDATSIVTGVQEVKK